MNCNSLNSVSLRVSSKGLKNYQIHVSTSDPWHGNAWVRGLLTGIKILPRVYFPPSAKSYHFTASTMQPTHTCVLALLMTSSQLHPLLPEPKTWTIKSGALKLPFIECHHGSESLHSYVSSSVITSVLRLHVYRNKTTPRQSHFRKVTETMIAGHRLEVHSF